jgi:hypothetical protein
MSERSSYPLPVCPKCGATAARCKRPSGHPSAWHAERRQAFSVAMQEAGAPEGDYDVQQGRAVLALRYPTPDEWEAMSELERVSWPDGPPHEWSRDATDDYRASAWRGSANVQGTLW